MWRFTDVAVEAGGADQDRAGVFESAAGLVMVVADGAGGTAGGAEAADTVVATVCHAVTGGRRADWMSVLREVDLALAGRGQTTAVVVERGRNELRGASVGDSEAWILGQGVRDELTRSQQRKPLIGSGRAVPVPFARRSLDGGVLMLGTDGLFQYASVERIWSAAMSGVRCAGLVDLVRLPNGKLHDDIAVVLCRR